MAKTVTSHVQLVFKAGDKSRKVTLRCAKTGLSGTECRTVGAALAAKGVFMGPTGAMNTYVQAERVERTVEVL